MSYDRLAPFYTSLETLAFGLALQEARCAGLGKVATGKVLIIGDGNGRFLEKAIHAWPNAEFVSIDASAGMLALAGERPGNHRARFIHADVIDGLCELENQTFEVVVTHFFLDCFCEDDLMTLVPMILAKVENSGVWYVSDFTDLKIRHRALLWVMYRFFGLFTETAARSLPDYRNILLAQGLIPKKLGSWRSGFIVANGWRIANRPEVT